MKAKLKCAAAGAAVLAAVLGALGAAAHDVTDPALKARFEYLSTNGNSNCTTAFFRSIPKMTVVNRLQGSCCSPMDLERYGEQIEGLKAYAAIAEIPANPYDIEAGLAQKLLAAYELALTPDEQAAYDHAMENSDEKGPCCCQCWRWHVYGGLGKLLIRDHGFTGEQLTEVWDLSDGCGGGEDHTHS